MLTILSPDTFKTIPWKNGLGHTTELAISDGGSLDNFDWRLSIASVVNDGDFSNFSDYQRNLVLIKGEGLTLDHRNGYVDNLTKLLDIARFDGGCNTHGALVNGGIKDFNIMTKQTSFSANVNCYIEQQSVTVELSTDSLVFAYSLTDEMIISDLQDESHSVPPESLAQLKHSNGSKSSNKPVTTITSKNLIVIQLLPS